MNKRQLERMKYPNKATREMIKKANRKFKDCLHPFTKQGCCDFCGEDLVGE
jgi:hypothetical protein